MNFLGALASLISGCAEAGCLLALHLDTQKANIQSISPRNIPTTDTLYMGSLKRYFVKYLSSLRGLDIVKGKNLTDLMIPETQNRIDAVD